MPIRATRYRRDAKRFLNQLDKGITNQAVSLAVQAHGRISGSSHPVKTGRGRAGWNVSVGKPSKAEPGSVRKGGMKLGQTVYTANGVPYLHFVEWGTVRITPRLFVSTALASMGLRPRFHIRGVGAVGSTQRALPGGI
jgi:hypothetical protein